MKTPRLRLVTANWSWFRDPTIKVSTVDLGLEDYDGRRFETALVTEAGVDDVERYATRAEAIQGHARWCAQVGLRP